MEGADQVLARDRVDRGLAADRAVDLGEQRGRYLDEAAAALQDRGGEPDQVADHPAAQRDDMVAAFDAESEQEVAHRLQLRPALRGLARRKYQCLAGDPCRVERSLDGSKMRRDVGIAHDRNAAALRQRRNQRARFAEQSGADMDRIAAGAQFDRYGNHRPIAFRIAATVASWGACWLATWIGASA